MLKVLHTSDWHIGKSLYAKKRYDEFEKFLDWLVELIRKEEIDLLLISGDIFDTTTPSNRALELYYSFLSKTSRTSCKKIVIIGGNHDSATSLDAPKQLLNALNISVVGSARDDICEEVIKVVNVSGECEAVVCAVPYLRERDVRIVEGGETLADKAEKLLLGVKEHYARVVEEARKYIGSGIPLIVMGHLFAARAISSSDDSERELYVGNLAHVDISELPNKIDYYALGHLHISQTVGGSDAVRYSGSPIAMSFGEADQEKKVLILSFNGEDTIPVIKDVVVPVFQKLKKISGNLEEILGGIEELKKLDDSVWIEVEYCGSDICSELKEQITSCVEGSNVEVRRVRNLTVLERSMSEVAAGSDIILEELDDSEVFKKCLEGRDFSEVQIKELNELYSEIKVALLESDTNAE